jgi:hypothetical protein
MKTLKVSGLFILIFQLFSCGSTMQNTWTKENYETKSFEKILVIGAFNTMEARNSFENTVTDMLNSKGIYAENSMAVLPPVTKITDISEKAIIKAVKDGNYDGVIIASLIDATSKDVRESGGPTYLTPYRYGYGRYAYARYGYVYTPDYYRQQNTYVVESSLFDANASSIEESMIWTGQSSLTDPSSYRAGAKTYAKRLVNTLLKSNVLKPE